MADGKEGYFVIMKQILWIGCYESEEEFQDKAKKGYGLASAQVSQRNLINGIEAVDKRVFDSINGSVLPPYPVYLDKVIKENIWEHKESAYDISVGYKNVKYLHRLNCKHAMIQAAKKWIGNRYAGNQLQVFVYSMRSAPMATACYIKRKIPQAHIYLIITDLPKFMDLGQNKVKAFLKKIDWISIKKMQHQFDGFILYASKMAEYLNIQDNKWLLMEGSYDKEDHDSSNACETARAIMYSGKLDEHYGIKMLIDAFRSIEDSELELWLTGSGNAEEYVKHCAVLDMRIKYFGFLPDRSDVLKLQKKASLLINMRLPSELASAYCFPSKLFEYMVTGIPVLTFRLEGIPDEYYRYMITIENEDELSVAKAIKKAFDLPSQELKNMGETAARFVLEEKNHVRQAARIIKFINEKEKDE